MGIAVHLYIHTLIAGFMREMYLVQWRAIQVCSTVMPSVVFALDYSGLPGGHAAGYLSVLSPSQCVQCNFAETKMLGKSVLYVRSFVAVIPKPDVVTGAYHGLNAGIMLPSRPGSYPS